jgi:two-component system secretion response regulator SsrB
MQTAFMRTFPLLKKRIGNNQQQRIFIIDRQPLVAYGIRKLLVNYPYLNVVGHTDNGLNATLLCRRFQPNLLIIDPDLSGMDGLDVVTQVKRRFPELRMIIYSSLRDEGRFFQFKALGVNGLIIKNNPLKSLLTAIHTVVNGKDYLDPALQAVSQDGLNNSETQELPKLSPRERQVLKLIAEGSRNRVIAELFSISIKTVESHRLNLMRKLDAHGVVDLVHWATRFGLI